MGDNQRVYPAEHSPAAAGAGGGGEQKLVPPPPGGTYVFQYPKQQTYNTNTTPPPPLPPARRRPARPVYFSPPRRRRSRCCCCCCWLLCLLVLLVFLVAVAGAVFYLLYRPQAPKYDVIGLAVKRFDFGKDQTLSAQFQVTVRARNPNKKIGIYYEKHNRLAVLYSGEELCSGGFPAFYQGHRNTTVIEAGLTGSGVRFSVGRKSVLNAQQAEGRVPLAVHVDVPAKIKLWDWKSPRIIVALRCSLSVNKLAANKDIRVGNKDCHVKVKVKVWKFTIP